MADEFDDKDLKQPLRAWSESANQQAERDEWFWTRQRARIAARAKASYPQRVPTLAWAGIAATVAVGVALMVPGDKSTHPNVTPVHKQSAQVEAQMSDHELMQQLQETMNDNLPDALQPGSNLQQVMETSYSNNSVNKVKESTR